MWFINIPSSIVGRVVWVLDMLCFMGECAFDMICRCVCVCVCWIGRV
jgi:hypothetical protein